MPRLTSRLLLALALAGAVLPASAITVNRIEVTGLPDEQMAQNVRVSLSLNDELGKDLS